MEDPPINNFKTIQDEDELHFSGPKAHVKNNLDKNVQAINHFGNVVDHFVTKIANTFINFAGGHDDEKQNLPNHWTHDDADRGGGGPSAPNKG